MKARWAFPMTLPTALTAAVTNTTTGNSTAATTWITAATPRSTSTRTSKPSPNLKSSPPTMVLSTAATVLVPLRSKPRAEPTRSTAVRFIMGAMNSSMPGLGWRDKTTLRLKPHTGNTITATPSAVPCLSLITNLAANRGSSNFDQRHSLSISYVYALPFFKGSGLEHKVLGGWQVQGITVAQKGLPFSVTNGANFGDNAGVGNGTGTGSRPDLASDPRSGFTPNQDSTQSGPLQYNPDAFAAPTGLTFGNVGRNTLNLPRRVNFNFTAFKRFPINEKSGFEFRWESFNLFNHTQFNSIDSSLPTPATTGTFASTSFMHLTGTHDPRRMQFCLRFYF